jgi:hypothetical protein
MREVRVSLVFCVLMLGLAGGVSADLVGHWEFD